jgi:hypothetical protein
MYPSIWDSDGAPSVEQANAIDKKLAGTGNMVYIGGPDYAVDSSHPWTPELVEAYRTAGHRTFPMYVGRQSKGIAELGDTAEAISEGEADASETVELLEKFGYGNGTYVGNDYEISSDGETTSAKVLAYLTTWAKHITANKHHPILYSGPSVIVWLWNEDKESFEGVIVAEWVRQGIVNPNLNPYQIPSLPHTVFPKLRGWQYSNDVVADGVPEAGSWTIDANVYDTALLNTDKVIAKAEPTESTKPAEPTPEKEDVFTLNVKFPICEYGSTGRGVRIVQALLSEHDFDVAIDGDFKVLTESAVKGFQVKHGLKQDGIVGLNTLTALLADN